MKVVITTELLNEAISGLKMFGGSKETIKKLENLLLPMDSICIWCGADVSSQIGCQNEYCQKQNLSCNFNEGA